MTRVIASEASAAQNKTAVENQCCVCISLLY